MAPVAMKGMREAVTCAVCSEVYQTGSREPLVLPCGHTFCRPCLVTIKTSGNFLCPTCRKCHNPVVIEQLSVNYSLLSISSVYTDFEYGGCSEHGDDLRYWCCGCELPLCSLCLYSGHPQGHNVQLAKSYVQEKKVDLEAQIKVINMKIEEERKKVGSRFRNVMQGMSELCQGSSTLYDIQLDVTNLLDNVKKASSIDSIVIAEGSVKEFHAQMIKFTSCNSDFDELWSVQDNLLHDKSMAAEESGTQEFVDAPDDQARTGGATGLQERHQKEERHVRLDYQDGRLLLHSLKDIANEQRILLKLPSEVFLEMSVCGRQLGRVYIRLWSHLRRAQQFLALCLGTLGPSYLGTYASKVINKNAEREMLVFENHLESNNSVSTRPLLTDLEWGGPFAAPIKEGLLMTFEPGRGAASSMTTSFGICSRDQPGGLVSCPFGEVISGLETVKAAAAHDPVVEVRISKCGVVFPDLVLSRDHLEAHNN